MKITIPRTPTHQNASSILDVSGVEDTFLGRALTKGGLHSYEPETLAAAAAIIQQRKVHAFADVGSNIGLFSWVLKAIFGDALAVTAFEPLPALAGHIANIARANGLGIDIRNEALGAVSGEATLYVSAQSDASNSLNPRFRKSKDEIQVKVRTGDELFASLLPGLIKIDTESTEPDVLRGSEEYIESARPHLIIEVLAGRTEGAIKAFVERFGYHGYRLDGRTWDEPQPIEGDTTYKFRDWLLAPEKPEQELRDAYGDWLKAFLQDHARR